MQEILLKAKTQADRICVVSQGSSYTYAELLEASALVAATLLEGEEDLQEMRVAFLVPPGFDYVKIQWGIWRAGGIAVPLCTVHPLPSLRYVIENTDAEVLIVSDKFKSMLQPLAAERKIRFISVDGIESSILKPLPKIEAERRAMILYTSGTTNLPKGVVTTHANILAQIETLVDAWEWSQEDHILCILPLHHVHGIINVVSCALFSGAKVEFLPKFDPVHVFDLFLLGQINLFMAVPTIYYKLIAYWEQQNVDRQTAISSALNKFRLMVSGSAALPISVLKKWRKISGHTLLERYGMTEIGMAVSNSYRGERRPGHIGLPLPGVELRLVDEENKPVVEGKQGEIQVKGANVFLEYWKNPEATAKAFTQDQWFMTGDIAIYDKGSYRILGRNSVDIIKSGGYKISALEIEEVLRTHPLIKDCGVVGIADEEWGEIIAASLVVENEKPDLQELQSWLRERMPAYRIPRKFIFQDDLPRNTLGKVTKNELKRLF